MEVEELLDCDTDLIGRKTSLWGGGLVKVNTVSSGEVVLSSVVLQISFKGVLFH